MHNKFLKFAKEHGCRLEHTGKGNTTRIYYDDQNIGYVNSTVIRRRACYGYRFWRDHKNDAAPAGGKVQFSQRYGDLSGLDWHSGTGTKNSHRTFLCIKDPEAAQKVLLEDISRVKISRQNSRLPDEVHGSNVYTEGSVHRVEVNRYERDPQIRSKCIAAHGTTCCVCGFSFGEVYGPEADGYIHVHHLRPLSECDGEYVVDPVKDLRPVCPNCHAMLHLGERCRTIEEVKQLLQKGGRR